MNEVQKKHNYFAKRITNHCREMFTSCKMIRLLRIQWYVMAVLLFISCNSGMKQEPETYRNPIIPGFAPDPSICRVGDDFYLINSTFWLNEL